MTAFTPLLDARPNSRENCHVRHLEHDPHTTAKMVKIGNPPDNFGLCKKAIALSYRVDIDQPAKHAMKFTAQTRASRFIGLRRKPVSNPQRAERAVSDHALCAQIVIVKGNPGFAGQID
jgi:hypothetical protein